MEIAQKMAMIKKWVYDLEQTHMTHSPERRPPLFRKRRCDASIALTIGVTHLGALCQCAERTGMAAMLVMNKVKMIDVQSDSREVIKIHEQWESAFKHLHETFEIVVFRYLYDLFSRFHRGIGCR